MKAEAFQVKVTEVVTLIAPKIATHAPENAEDIWYAMARQLNFGEADLKIATIDFLTATTEVGEFPRSSRTRGHFATLLPSILDLILTDGKLDQVNGKRLRGSFEKLLSTLLNHLDESEFAFQEKNLWLAMLANDEKKELLFRMPSKE